tara:strand:+ start:5454 stop:6893 length:1440 start_codon:yes stop_codon:yes gene_type:complete
MANPVAGSGLNVTNPLPTQQTASANYLDFSTGWAQQYLPELYEAEVERYGNRMLSGFLSQVGAEEAMASDQVVWSEQGRLHISAESTACDASANKVRFSAADAALFRLHDTVLLYGIGGASSGKTIKAIVTVVADGSNDVVMKPYTQATLDATGTGEITFADNSLFRAMVYGSEHKKGTSLDRPALNPGFNKYDNKPVIIRDRFIINGSDTAQIGWVEVSGEEGQSGYMWYLKAEGDTRARFNDYLEMTVLESVKKSGNGAPGVDGTQGMFDAIETRGHVTTDAFTGEYTSDIATFDNILIKFDGQGAIEENMLYLDRHTTLKIDDMLGNLNSGVASAASPTSASFGVFNNSADMAVNLGFSGFRRGSYDFYKTDWKYLNDLHGHGSNTPGAGNTKIAGAIIPAGVSSVYDEGMGKNIKRPFLHVRYRKSDTEDRKLKSWITGSVGGNITSDEDAMVVNYLSERCLVVQAANNFMLLKR